MYKLALCINGYYNIETGEEYQLDLDSLYKDDMDGRIFVDVYDADTMNWISKVDVKRFDIDPIVIAQYVRI
jgi:hypothetical protein